MESSFVSPTQVVTGSISLLPPPTSEEEYHKNHISKYEHQLERASAFIGEALDKKVTTRYDPSNSSVRFFTDDDTELLRVHVYGLLTADTVGVYSATELSKHIEHIFMLLFEACSLPVRFYTE